MVLNIIIIFMTLSQSKAVKLELFELPEHSYPHPQPYCNDGTQAVYYHDTDFSKLGKIHVHLNGGSLCDSDEACIQRCDKDGDGIVDNRVCLHSCYIQINYIICKLPDSFVLHQPDQFSTFILDGSVIVRRILSMTSGTWMFPTAAVTSGREQGGQQALATTSTANTSSEMS